jgi:hypothetical protein
MLLFLLACHSQPGDTGVEGADASDTSGDSGDTSGDSGADDTAGAFPTEIAPGPACAEQPLPMDAPFNVVVGHVVEGAATDAELADLRRLVDEWTGGVSGPWAHDVRGPYVLADDLAVAGGGTALSAASVADVLQREDGSFVMIFVDGDLDRMLAQAARREPFRTGLRGLGGLSAATSSDGETWTPAELSVAAPFPAYAVDPELVPLPGGGAALYFLGVPPEELCADSPDPFMVPSAHRMYRADSDNMLDWTEAHEVWANPDGGTDPAVWCVTDTRCFGWFWGGISSDDGGQTWAATDEVTVSVTPQLPDVVAMDGGWRMFLLASEGVSTAFGVDGTSFTFEGSLGVGAASPSVVVADDAVQLYLSGPPPP